MLIMHVLEQPCPSCGFIGRYGNVSISGNTLRRGCNNCGQSMSFPLPKLKKKIIYLDQFFLFINFSKKNKTIY